MITTPGKATEWLKSLPDTEHAAGQAALEALWEDGFLVGAGGLPRRNPMQPPASMKNKGKSR